MLCDTNILLRYAQSADPRHSEVLDALAQLATQREPLQTCRQCLFEFWVVTTRPVSQNGYGVDAESCNRLLTRILNVFTVVDEPENLVAEWRQLCTDNAVLGRQAHDARIAALMPCHGIDTLLTLNPSDFARFTEISVVTPLDVLAGVTP